MSIRYRAIGLVSFIGVAKIQANPPPAVLKADAGANPFFAVDPGMALWTWITFFIVLAILYKFAWNPILSALDEREKNIQDSLDNASRLANESREIEKKNTMILHKANEEAKKIIEEAKSAALHVKQELEVQGRKEAEIILEKARHALRQEREVAIEKLKKNSVDLAIKVSQRLIEENLSAEKNRVLAEKYLQEVEKF